MKGLGECYRKNSGDEIMIVTGKSNKTIFNFELSWLTPIKKRELVIVAEKLCVVLDAVNQKIKIINYDRKNDKNEISIIEPEIIPNNTIQDELLHFLKCIEYKDKNISDGTVGAKIVEILENVKLNMINH